MKSLTVDQIRDRYLDFFAARGHHVLPSFPLVPQGDNSLLLINAGMTPMKKFFTGQEKPPSKRVTTCQKCIRTTDVDDVGKDARHGSFFEMLGNFSFGDYFKKEVIPWAWEFLTVVMEIPKEKLLISVYEEDDEAYAIWRDDIGVPEEKIYRFDKGENFWEHGVGPCGPCSEIHFDRGAALGCGKPDCALGCDCDRFMEVWNLVFIQFEKLEDGSYIPLKNKGIDTGMGLERIAIVMQNAPTIFDIDNIKVICDKVMVLAKLGELTKEQRVSVSIIADHVRSVAFMAADGVLPSNEGRGYVLRRLLRRAVRHGQSLGIDGAFVVAVAKASIDAYSHAYSNLTEKESFILQTLAQEESRFMETLDMGMNILQKHIDSLKADGKSTISSADAFRLYDTYGFPSDLTREILEDAGLKFDEEGFVREMEAQKQRARQARGVSNYMGAGETVYHKLEPNMPTEFCGYEMDAIGTGTSAKVLAIVADGDVVDEASAGQDVSLVLDRTQFYAESGGQKGDIGSIYGFTDDFSRDGLHIKIDDCIKVAGGNTVHIGKINRGAVRKGETVAVTINMEHRKSIMGNHSATHLLQKVLRDVLGDHVEQSGSEVSSGRLRFDFTHNAPLTLVQRNNIEYKVNEYIFQAIPVEVEDTTPEEARKRGAMALFGEKYGDKVRMVKMVKKEKDNEGKCHDVVVSIELCGGTHVSNTQQIGLFKLLSEGGIASGVRRIEAITGLAALNNYKEAYETLQTAVELCKVQKLQDVPARLDAILAENKELKKELTRIQSEASGQGQAGVVADLCKNAETHKGFTFVTGKMENYDIEALRGLADMLRKDVTSGCVLLCGVNAGAAQFLAFATDDAVKAGIHAGEIVKEAAKICGGGGGGKPSQAQAGGKNAEHADAALAKAIEIMKTMV